jgi:hypothetical protein
MSASAPVTRTAQGLAFSDESRPRRTGTQWKAIVNEILKTRGFRKDKT